MLASSALAGALNHLLRAQPAQRDRLQRFAGRHLELRVLGLRLGLRIDPAGGFLAARGATADTRVELSTAGLIKIAAGARPHAGDFRLQGDPGLAALLSGLALQLSWDVEEDLSALLGDVLAHRVVRAARSLGRLPREAAASFADNLSEYWTEEIALAAPAWEVEAFVTGVDGLREDVARLEKRLERLARA